MTTDDCRCLSMTIDDCETCPNSVNSELLKISELKNQYKVTLITVKLTKIEGTQGIHETKESTELKEP